MTNQKSQTLKTLCGDVITKPEDHSSAEYRGEKVYFCAESCLKAFQDNPDKYVASHNQE
jgi:YHS domain-containing protein